MANTAVVVDEGKKSLWAGGMAPMKASYGKLMMWFFLLSDAFTFSALLIAYGMIRYSHPAFEGPISEFVFSLLDEVTRHGCWIDIFPNLMELRTWVRIPIRRKHIIAAATLVPCHIKVEDIKYIQISIFAWKKYITIRYHCLSQKNQFYILYFRFWILDFIVYMENSVFLL